MKVLRTRINPKIFGEIEENLHELFDTNIKKFIENFKKI